MKILLIGMAFLCSCGNTDVSKQSILQDKSSLDNLVEHSCIYKITNNEIVKYIFSIDVFTSNTSTIESVFKIKPSIKIEKKKGAYDEAEYTNYVFETPNAFVNLFKNNEGYYIEEAFIKGDEIRLYKNCSIGMLKKDFCKQIAIENTECDTIVIVDEDQTLNLNFIFNKGYLKELKIDTSE